MVHVIGLRNWSVMNIHLPTAISCSSEYSEKFELSEVLN